MKNYPNTWQQSRYVSQQLSTAVMLQPEIGNKIFSWSYTCMQPPINITPCPYLRVMQRSIPWVMWKAVIGVQGTTCRKLLPHTLAKGALVYQSQSYCVEGFIQWGSNSSVINDPFGEPGHMPLHLGLLSAWGSVDSDNMVSACFTEQLLNWRLWEIWINE
jgi:hypothetical protein